MFQSSWPLLLLLPSRDVLRSVERGVENGEKQSSSAFSEPFATRCELGMEKCGGCLSRDLSKML